VLFSICHNPRVHFPPYRDLTVGNLLRELACALPGNDALCYEHGPRYTFDELSWEIPEGGVPDGETPLEGIARELREETGLEAAAWRELCRVDLSNSVTDERAILYVATDLRHGEAAPEPTESIELRWVPFEDVLAMTVDGRITDAMSVVAIQRLALERAGAVTPDAGDRP